MTTFIPLADCVRGHVYRVRSRNLVVAVFDGERGFVGIRVKFGEKYLFTEYHRDSGPPHGTVCPIEDIGAVPDHIALVESLGTACRLTGRLVEWKGVVEQGGDGWCYVDTGGRIPEYPESHAIGVANKALFDWLLPLTTAA